MKSQIIEYFKSKNDEKSLGFIDEIEKTGAFSGLNEVIWDLQSKVKDLSEQLALMEMGSDPLSQNLCQEINEMKEYLVKTMVKENINDLLLIYYFTDFAQLSESPIDIATFNLKNVINTNFKL